MGVQALIQQYTVPPGTVPSLSPSKDESLSKVSRSTSSASAQSKRGGEYLEMNVQFFLVKVGIAYTNMCTCTCINGYYTLFHVRMDFLAFGYY